MQLYGRHPLVAAAIVVRGAGCEIADAAVPELGDSHLQEKRNNELTQETVIGRARV